jgi:hypothetical protein
MSQEKQGIFQKILTFLLNIGADPADSEEKAKSDGLLRRIEADLAQVARTQLMAFIRERRALSAAAICHEVLTDVHGFACGTQPCDDITLVVLKRTDA